ncbi:phenylalanine--tRNA ligase subunit beta [Haloflavibacter putidus]|uniref:Phenylalanine--tRNA ligase beta subunit n=1 Tax=Haloflavibacter putidus TaxID=2576776 RepID=A0A507ZSQ1_9FLAO|nr:phenylalanine--tRNA ligase subunit beta [Haloflavibacter putidus]TQD39274.1 phenylalanine--tRNA ligase subunit beta [Haloflavibacter putidus]
MKISYNWVKQFIKTDWNAEKTGKLLTDLGLEVEGIEQFESVKGGLEGIVVGHVLTCEKHQNADRLKLTTVEIGADEPLQIVCGAPNVAAGQNVPVATIGTTLYTPEGEAWKIKKGKIRGEVSEGMICAEDELGLGKSHEGIMVLDEKLAPGTPLKEIFDVETDFVYEIGLTPNRADAMSHFGVARDLKAGLLQQEINTSLVSPSVSNFHVENRSKRITVEVENYDLAPRYCGVSISGVKVGPSPAWLQNKLKAIGISPKNNIVDATNYVLHELGQPLHAFDADLITDNKILVKPAKKGTKFTTLDEVERELHEEDLIITDTEKPLAIAGVLGGLHSGVTEKTSSVFIESAYFNPVSVRKTAKRHGLNTDASFRFERGVDPSITKYALKRVTLLILENAGGYVSSDIDDIYPNKIEDFQVFLTFSKINKLIGQEIPSDTIKSILASLDIRVNNVTETGLGLTIPAYRVDVQREVDVIEEILRVYGYNNVEFNEKLNASISNSSRFEDFKLQNLIANQLVGQGFYEMMANSLTTKTYVNLDQTLNPEHTVEMLNPLSQDLSALRQSMLFSGLEAVVYNLNRKNEDLKLFEFGKTYHNFPSGREEKKHLSLLVTGNRSQERWNNLTQKSDFFYLKGIIKAVLERLGFTETKSKASSSAIFSEGLKLDYKKQTLVEFGVVRNSVLKHFDIEQEVLFADFNWDALIKLVNQQQKIFKPIAKFPSIRRDFALLIDKEVAFNDIYDIAVKTEKSLLKNVNLFDVYEGKNLPEGKKSYAVSFTFLDEKKTLTDKHIDKIMNKLQQKFEKQLGASLR